MEKNREKRKAEALERLQKKTCPAKPTETPPPLSPRKKTAAIEPAIRRLVIEKVLEKEELSWREASGLFHISPSSIHRIVSNERKRKEREVLQNTGQPFEVPPPKRKRGRKELLDGDDLLALLDWVEEDNGLTAKQLVSKLKEERGVQVSRATIDRFFSNCDLTIKDTLLIPSRWNNDDVIEKRKHFVMQFLNARTRPIVYVDESPFNLHVQKQKGRALKGHPAKLTLLPKGRNVTLLAALLPNGEPFHRYVESQGKQKRGVNATDFQLFVSELRPSLPANTVIVLDNAKIHHANILHDYYETLKRAWNIDILFLPPYSPFLNPIEYYFAKLKHLVRNTYFENKEQLRQRIEACKSLVTVSDYEGWVRHTLRYHYQCLVSVPFSGKPLYPDVQDLGISISTTTAVSSPQPLVQAPRLLPSTSRSSSSSSPSPPSPTASNGQQNFS